MGFTVLAKMLAKVIVLPPTGPLVLGFLGLAISKRAPRTGRTLMWLGFGSLLLLCLPLVAWLLTKPFDRMPFSDSDAAGAQAIVILGGGTRRNAPEYGGDTLGRLTLERVRYGARVAKATQLPVLVTGGVLLGAQDSEAALMSESLEREYGVPVRWSEGRSRNTHENARFSAHLLKNDGVNRVVLVAHAIDMPRAIAEFADAGISVIPAATGLPSRGSIELWDLLPSVPALQASRDALYELLANLARRIAGSSSPRKPAAARPRRHQRCVSRTSRSGADAGARNRNRSARRRALSFAITRARCTSTVRGLMPRSTAISRLCMPRTMRS